MKTKEKTFGELQPGDEFYAVEINFESVEKRKVLDVLEDTNDIVTLVVVNTDSTDYENESLAIPFPKDSSLYRRLKIYTTTIETAKKFIKQWERTKKKEIKEKTNRMLELLTKNEQLKN